MSDLYGKTTESLESLQNVSCGSRMTCSGRGSSGKKKPQKDIELASVEPSSEKDGDANEASELMPSGTNANAGTSPKKNFRDMAKGIIHANRVVSHPVSQQLRIQRQRQHLQKFSRLKTSDEGERDLVRASVGPTTTEREVGVPRGKRDNAAKVLFKAGVNKIKAKPRYDTSSWDTYGGRSFLPTDLNRDDDDDDGAILGAAGVSFFDFFSSSDARDEPTPIEETEETEETFARAAAPGGRSRAVISVKSRKKRRFWFSSILGDRMLRRSDKLTKTDPYEKREYFTVWLSFVQVVIMIVVLCTHPFAPIGKDVDPVEREVLLSREGVLYKEKLQRKVVESFWIGPSLESLILLGAKYAPCMRRDEQVYAKIEEERKKENNTGCCMQTTTENGCIQRESKYCISAAVEFKSKSVCGQDPNYCISSSKIPSTWDENSIIYWPKCDKRRSVPNNENNRHMTCEVTGRPCCINTQGQCVITTEDNCRFWDGIYHSGATLCSQVDCLSATCGNSFYTDDYPDQIYRLFVSLFLCAGILHLVIVLIFNFTLLRYIELYAGWFRTSLIFLITGIGGNLWSAILLPYQAEVGESGAMFGIFACVFIEGIQMWNLFERPWFYIGKLTLILFIMFLFGLLPYVDNFAHIFGFLYGILFGFVIMPHVTTKDDPEEVRREKMIYLILRVVSFILGVGLTILGLMLFYFTQDTQSEGIALFNCPFGNEFCLNFHQGQELEDREIEY